MRLDRSAWTRVTFGDVVANVNDYFDRERDGILPYVAGPHINPGEVTPSGYGSTDDDGFPPTFKRKFLAGDALLHSRGIGKLVAVDRVGVTGEKLFVLRATDQTVLLQTFLPWLMLSPQIQSHMRANFTGSVNKFLNWKPLESMKVLLPPLGEQQRIADLLWAGERHHLALLDEAGALKQVAAALIAGLRTSTDSVSYVRDVAKVSNGQNYPKAMQDGRPGDVPFFKVADLDRPGNERYLTNPDGWVTAEDVIALSAQLLPPGTIVTARVGAAIHLERRRALQAPALVDENHLVIRPIAIDSDYLLAVLSETKLARSRNGGVVPSLNQKLVGAVPVPNVAAEAQRRVGAAYRTLGDVREFVRSEDAALRASRSAFLSAVFGGN